ncbi:Gfo/Idh/MocA family oxidoreductase [Kaistia dalseonensis]|uniref:Dehydrogenase n=1 Tax=Kaistia dalseonensis TaxID=410840 RepID=A0ABU0HAT6_9HYPH|nr:Gfo/Idh/MocA family oxidoreductase [Kaistia dalseonensis]MCX5496802.1 Gfo/Idh/MocA family oxidoreductase [Kaistia dalseonensis]MDQ0439428.1 putative dehydrogenase [Kaistia dalseonensis]
MPNPLRLGVIGAGLKAADYARSWVKMPEVAFVASADVGVQSRRRLADICTAAGKPEPREFDDFRDMLAACRDEMDAVYVSTPHAFHAEQAIAVVEAGLDLLLEKPMVTTVPEAEQLVAAQRKSGATVVIAFQGGLSPLVLDTQRRARAGEFGALVNVGATIFEGWKESYNGHWKQQPEISGGGFMFDTGAHMMNTICLLADSDFERVSAYMNNRGKPVDITCAVSARLKSGALCTFTAAGEGPPGCASYMTLFFSEAIIRIDAWGGWREISMPGVSAIRETAETLDNPMKTFLAIRAGELENSSTVENGLRFAQLWDGIKASAAQDGDSILIEAARIEPQSGVR